VPRVLIPLVAGLLVGSLFITANVAALRDPTPHEVPVAVAGAPPAPLQRALDAARPGGYDVRRVGSAETSVRQRDTLGALDVRAGTVVTASANGFAASMTLEQALVRAAPRAGVIGPRTRDAVPLQPGDPMGLSLAQIVLGTIMGGFLMGVLTAQLALGEPLWQRLLAYAGFAAAFGLLAALVLGPLLGALEGDFLQTWLWVAVPALSIAVAVGALARLLGQPGIAVAVVTFLIVGNPSAGASAPTEYLPAFFRAVGPWLPPNAAASALLGTTYFDGAILRPSLVLAAWVAVPLALLLALDRTRGSRRALAYDAAGAATDRADREDRRR
jgi:hypothetical protein